MGYFVQYLALSIGCVARTQSGCGNTQPSLHILAEYCIAELCDPEYVRGVYLWVRNCVNPASAEL